MCQGEQWLVGEVVFNSCCELHYLLVESTVAFPGLWDCFELEQGGSVEVL